MAEISISGIITILCRFYQTHFPLSIAGKSKSIRKQIMLGYSRIILMVFLLVALVLVSLFLRHPGRFEQAVKYRKHRCASVHGGS